MKESVIYQEILAEGEVRGELKGRQEGRQNESRSLLFRLLSKKFGTLSDRYQTQITSLSLEQMELLSEALLDFSKISDLDRWLKED